MRKNRRPVVITHSLHGVDLNSPESNYHMIAFCWQDNWIILDVFHGMTDGTGAYEIVRTLLYYYCSGRYNVTLNDSGIRLAGDEISQEEWIDPVAGRTDLPTTPRAELSDALSLTASAGLQPIVSNTGPRSGWNGSKGITGHCSSGTIPPVKLSVSDNGWFP